MMIVLSKSKSIHFPYKAIYPFEMIRFRYLSANYCRYEMPFRSLKFFPFHMTRKMTVRSIVNRGRKIPCRISNRQSCFISKRTSSVISKRQTVSFRNDSFAFDSSIINLNVLSKWQIIYHFEMQSHSLIPIRWAPDQNRQRDRERYLVQAKWQNFVRRKYPAGRSAEWWYICKLSSLLLLLKIFRQRGLSFSPKTHIL